jgi:hypothetical protein
VKPAQNIKRDSWKKDSGYILAMIGSAEKLRWIWFLLACVGSLYLSLKAREFEKLIKDKGL